MMLAEGPIDGVVIKPAKKFGDDRGWLAEIFRSDETAREFMPAMGYISVTHPGVSRGPHEHVTQTDLFGFFGPGSFRLKLWDNRKTSPTYGNMVISTVGEENPVIVSIPPGVAHGYRNVGSGDAWVINLPNRLFERDPEKRTLDEIRYENVKDCPFVL